MKQKYIVPMTAEKFCDKLEDHSVHLLVLDPPYYKIVDEKWDKKWTSMQHYVTWMTHILRLYYFKLTPDASVNLFGAVGYHKHHPIFELILNIDINTRYFYRDFFTWKKRRGYGKEHGHLFCREEFVWYSVSEKNSEVRFTKQYLDEKRGYAGFNKKYPAKSEYKRVSNVWADIPELLKPSRQAEKPVPLMERIIASFSRPGDLVVDCFAGCGPTGVAAINLGRRFLGCDEDKLVALKANKRVIWNQIRKEDELG